jgi:hypothetical protein
MSFLMKKYPCPTPEYLLVSGAKKLHYKHPFTNTNAVVE